MIRTKNNMKQKYIWNISLWRKTILEQTKRDLWRKIYIRQLWNILDLEITFWVIGKKCLEKNTKNSKLKKNYSKNQTKKPKKKTFCNLDINSVSDNKKLWQIINPLFSNKIKVKTAIELVDNNKMIDDTTEIAKLINECFVNIVKKK